MSTPYDPMTFDELSRLYRVEMDARFLSKPRKDLYRAMAALLSSLRQEADRQMSRDPDSVMSEGADARRRAAERLCKDIVILRTKKLAALAASMASGSPDSTDCVADDEREYFDSCLALTRQHIARMDKMRGRRSYVLTRIDGEPVTEEPVIEESPYVDTVRTPVKAVTEVPPISPEQDETPFDEEPFDEPFDEEPFEDDPEQIAAVTEETPAVVAEKTSKMVEPEAIRAVEKTEMVLIRVLEDLPPFVGAERDYQLSKEDIVTLPKVLADILISGGKAVEIRPTA